MERKTKWRAWFYGVSIAIILGMVGAMGLVRAMDRNLDKFRRRVIVTEGYYSGTYRSCVKKQAIMWPYLVPYTYYSECVPSGPIQPEPEQTRG